jgi:hypothetical protein
MTLRTALWLIAVSVIAAYFYDVVVKPKCSCGGH